jgi:3-methyl-2-oxobutanoate hydroxymethyltransferase
MPFMSYGVTEEETLHNAARFISEAGAQAVKVEGGVRSFRTIEAIVRAGIPIMGHIGLTPQSVHGLGGHRVQGKTIESARRLLADALAVQEAGAFSVVLELVPTELAAAITARLRIPTIGIGAGSGCSGQVQVITGRTHRHRDAFGNTLPNRAGINTDFERLFDSKPVILRRALPDGNSLHGDFDASRSRAQLIHGSL